MRNLVLIFSLTLLAITFNLNGQTRSNGFRPVPNAELNFGTLFKCPNCQKEISWDHQEILRSDNDVNHTKNYYVCNFCGSQYVVDEYMEIQHSSQKKTRVYLIPSSKRKEHPQKREHKINDKCTIEDSCFVIEGASPNIPTQHIRIIRKKCKFAIEFTITRTDMNNRPIKTETKVLSPGAIDFSLNADGEKYIISNVRHVQSSGVNNQQNNTQSPKRNNTRQKSRRK